MGLIIRFRKWLNRPSNIMDDGVEMTPFDYLLSIVYTINNIYNKRKQGIGWMVIIKQFGNDLARSMLLFFLAIVAIVVLGVILGYLFIITFILFA